MVREPFNALSHALGVPLALLGGLLLLLLAPREAWPALLAFGLTMALMFGASALYHTLKAEDRLLAWLRRLDHAAIFLFIAGSYTPFLAEGLEGGDKALALALVWGLALLGVGFRLLYLKAPRWLYTLAYLALGWLSSSSCRGFTFPFPPSPSWPSPASPTPWGPGSTEPSAPTPGPGGWASTGCGTSSSSWEASLCTWRS